MLSQIETAYGKMIGSDPLGVVAVSPSLQRVYVLIKFDKGPLYASFDCYKTEGGWIIPIMDFNTKANLVLPQSLESSSVAASALGLPFATQRNLSPTASDSCRRSHLKHDPLPPTPEPISRVLSGRLADLSSLDVARA